MLLDSSLGVTGALRCAAHMARLLAPQVRTIAVLPERADLPPDELAAFAQVVRLPLVQIRKSPRDLILFGPALLRSGLRLRALLGRSGASALLVNDFFQLQGVVARMLGFRGRLITWVRIDPRAFPRALSRFWLGVAYRVSDHIVAVSDFIAGLIPPGPKVRRIYDPVDSRLTIGTAKSGRRADIVQVGNYIAGKGQDDALDAFIAIAADFAETRLLFFGGDMGLEKNRAFRRRLEQRAVQSGYGDRVIFEGYAHDVPAALSTAAVVVNLSKSESFSLTCLEAGQLGRPVVAYRSGGPEEIIVDGETGHLCDIGDVEAAAGALRRLLSDPAQATRMGAAAAAHVEQRFGAAAFVAQLRAMLDLDSPAAKNGSDVDLAEGGGARRP